MEYNSNLELDRGKYRKIPSLQYLYEVNAQGTVRNVKSKRVRPVWKDEKGRRFVSVIIKGERFVRVVDSLVAECWKHSERDPVPVTIAFGPENIHFSTLTQCARYISDVTGHSYGIIRKRLRQRRRYIHGYKIFYPSNAETGHGDPRG